MFRDFEVGATFHYLPSFRRIRVDFESHLSASNAKQHMDSTIIGENTIHCYFIQVMLLQHLIVISIEFKRKQIFMYYYSKYIINRVIGFVTMHRRGSVFACTPTGETISNIASL